MRGEAGSRGCEILCDSYHIRKGKPKLKGLPDSFGTEEEVETLEVVCVDRELRLKVILSYSVFEKSDMIARNVRLINEGEEHLRIEKVLSACIDMDDEEFEMVTLAGGMGQRAPASEKKAYIRETDGVFLERRVKPSGAPFSGSCNT